MCGDKTNHIAMVTGGTGFIGSYLVRRLLRDGWAVHILVRPRSSLSVLGDAVERVVVHTHDGCTEEMVRIVREAAPCVVFHLASLFLSQHTSDDVERLIQSNVLLGTQLAEAMSVCGVKRLLNTGTSWQHYQNQDYSPVNLYAATKQAFEDVLQYYVEAAGLQVITLKLFDTYGPNDPRPKLLQLLSHASREGKPLDMSPGEQSIDLVHIDDVVEAFGIAARRLLNEQVTGHESYAVGSGQAMRLQDVVMVFESAAGVKVPVRWGRRPYRVREVMVPADNLERLPGWSPRIKLEDGLRESIAGNKAVHPRSLDETGK